MWSECLDSPDRSRAARRLPAEARRPVPPGRWLPARSRDADACALIDEISSYLHSLPTTGAPTELGGGSDPHRIRVLLPYSGSAEAERAVDEMIRMASVLRAEVRVLHVRQYDTCRGARFFLSCQEEAVRLTVDAVSRLRRRGIAATGVVRGAPMSKVGHVIVKEAIESHVSMILIGAHRRRFPLDYLRRDVVRAVLRRASCAVLVVRTDPPQATGTVRGASKPDHREGPNLPHAA